MSFKSHVLLLIRACCCMWARYTIKTSDVLITVDRFCPGTQLWGGIVRSAVLVYFVSRNARARHLWFLLPCTAHVSYAPPYLLMFVYRRQRSYTSSLGESVRSRHMGGCHMSLLLTSWPRENLVHFCLCCCVFRATCGWVVVVD